MKLILQAIKSLFRKFETALSVLRSELSTVKNAADTAQTTATKAQNSIKVKMNANNPTGTGSILMNSGGTASRGSFIMNGDGTKENCVHVEGLYCNATGFCSHAEGSGTYAYGDYSHVEGGNTHAHGDYSHVEGEGTVGHGDHSHVQGRFNIEDVEGKFAHIVGNGTGVGEYSSNAHTIDWDGNAWFAGSVEGTAVILSSPSGKRFNITVDDSGTLTTTEITA